MEEDRKEQPGEQRADRAASPLPTASEDGNTLSPPQIDQTTALLSPATRAALTPALPATAVLETVEAEGNLLRSDNGPSSLEWLRRGSIASPNADYFSTDAQWSSSTPSTTTAPSLSAHGTDDAERFVHGARHDLYGPKSIETETHDPSRPDTFRRVSVVRPPQRSKTDHPNYPEYPEQSFAALQGQERYYHSSHFEREDPTQTHVHGPGPPPESPLLEPRKLTLNTRTHRTAGNTPTQTPGLFAATGTTAGVDAFDERHTLPSPYLHPVQAPAPRTTRSVQRDVDYISGRKLINRYEIIDELGRGVQGKVKLARNLETGELVAIKIVQRYLQRRRLGKIDPPEDKVKKEIAILKKVRHPNVVRLIEVIDDPDIAKVYIVLEFCEQRELVWRTEGLSHIVLMEYNRQMQEYGDISFDTSAAKMDRIQQKVARRRARQARKQRRARASQSAQGPDLWSLEYAHPSDDDDSDDETTSSVQLSRYDSRPATTVLERIPEDHGTASPDPEHTPLATSTQLHDEAPEGPFPTFQTTSPTKAVPDMVDARLMGGETGAEVQQDTRHFDEGFSFYSTEWYQNEDVTPNVTELDEKLRRRRQASVAESTNSGITEVMDNEVPDYYRYVPTMTLNECRSAFRDALVGLSYLHYHGIIHRDIKPENLLRTHESRVKISDFGVSYLGRPLRDAEDPDDPSEVEVEAVNWDTEKGFAKTVGTPAFYAPELCNLHEADDTKPLAKDQVDVWAIGVTLFCLVFARVPFDAENEFALMARIHDEDIFIPRQRLKAVDPSAAVKSPGQPPLFQKDKRNPHDFDLEPIDDELYDLMRRLYNRDPSKRISLPEIKLHPWVLRGIHNPRAWLDETDPERLGHGKILEPSNEEVAEAVIPITILGRLKSIGKRATSALGLSNSRKRGQSSTNSSETGSTSSFPDVLDRQSRRQSVQVGAQAYANQKSQREKEAEHPLSRSVTASPEPEDTHDLLEDPPSPTSSPLNLKGTARKPPVSRPSLPDRHPSEISTTGSIRTLRPSDFERERADFERGRRGSSHSPPDPDETPEIQQPTPTTATFGSILSGGARHIIRAAMRSRERFGSGSASPHRRSGNHTPAEHEQPFGETTASVTNASAPGHTAGHMDFPMHLKEKLSAINNPTLDPTTNHSTSVADSSQSSGKNSAQPSRQLSMLSDVPGRGFLSPFHTQPPSPSISIPSRRKVNPVETEGGASAASSDYASRTTEASEAEYRHAKEDMARRRALQAIQDREHTDASRPSSSIGPQPCPPSPDDEQNARQQGRPHLKDPSSATQEAPLHSHSFASSDTSSASHSRSTSFPSVPSAVSADSSVYSDAQHSSLSQDKDESPGSSDTANTRTEEIHPSSAYPSTSSVAASDPGYHGDGDGNSEDNYAVESDEDDDSDDEFLTMSHNKSARLDNTSTGQRLRPKERRETTLSKTKGSRSGSTNTISRVWIHGKGDQEQEQEESSSPKA